MHLQLLAHVTHVEFGSGLLIYAVGLATGLLAARLLGFARLRLRAAFAVNRADRSGRCSRGR